MHNNTNSTDIRQFWHVQLQQRLSRSTWHQTQLKRNRLKTTRQTSP